MRGVIIAISIAFMANNDSDSIQLLWLVVVIVGAIRMARPFINEIVLLEKNPLRSSDKGAITVGRRSSRLHGPSSGDLFARSLLVALVLLTAVVSVGFTLWFLQGLLTNLWIWGHFMVRVCIPLSMWIVAIYATVFPVSQLPRFAYSPRRMGSRTSSARRCFGIARRASMTGCGNQNRHHLLAIGMLFVMTGPTSLFAQAVDSHTAVESGKDALKSKRLPWYDPNADELQRTDLPVKNQPKVARDWTYAAPSGNGMNLDWLWRMLQYFVWGILAALFAYLLFLAIKSLTGVRSEDSTYELEDDTRSEADRIENLPFQMEQRRTGDLLGDASRLYEAGNYNEAIVYLFSHQLVQLDKDHLIRLTKGKTNRQYTAELRPRVELRAIVTQTMLAFEDVFFGHHQLSKEQFENCWNQLEHFNRELQIPHDALAAPRPLGVAT